MTKSTSKSKLLTPIEEALQIQFVKRVKQTVSDSPGIKQACSILRMSPEEIQKILDDNP